MNRLMTSGGPACALWQAVGVIGIADENTTVDMLLLEMAFKAKRRIACDQHALIHRPVRRVTGNATLPDRIMFEYERTTLRGVTLYTSLVSR